MRAALRLLVAGWLGIAFLAGVLGTPTHAALAPPASAYTVQATSPDNAVADDTRRMASPRVASRTLKADISAGPTTKSSVRADAANTDNLLARKLVTRNERAWLGIPGRQYDPDQRALVDLAKDAKRRGGLPEDEADILATWADEYGLPGHHPPG